MLSLKSLFALFLLGMLEEKTTLSGTGGFFPTSLVLLEIKRELAVRTLSCPSTCSDSFVVSTTMEFMSSDGVHVLTVQWSWGSRKLSGEWGLPH